MERYVVALGALLSMQINCKGRRNPLDDADETRM